MKKILPFSFLSVFLVCFLSNCDNKNISSKNSDVTCNTITFSSSDTKLDNLFVWAKKQALAYAFTGDPVGLWYEAALPGREVFCMRDVAHQAMGAQFLGLGAYTKNMLFNMAKNVSDARDWCSYWEITRYGTPAIQDYLNDNEFWYNLPANFDVLDCCFRMYELTGDQDYLSNPVFLNFYKRTVYDYVDRWDLGIDKIMNRSRIINTSPDNNRKFRNFRGIPGYNEEIPDYTASLDLIFTEEAAFYAYARLQQLRCNDEEALKFYNKAIEVENFINTVWWDGENQRYFTNLSKNHELSSRGFDRFILYWGSINDTSKLRPIIKTITNNHPTNTKSGIEGLSHLPEVLYKYEQPEKAYDMLQLILRNDRREYPEASFSTIGAMVAGLMGIEMELYPRKASLVTGDYGEQILTTKSRLTNNTKWAEIKHVPIMRNDISVRHEGLTKTTLTNNSGPQLLWKAFFPGEYDNLLLNGNSVKANTEVLTANGEKVTWIKVIVGAGEKMTVQVPE